MDIPATVTQYLEYQTSKGCSPSYIATQRDDLRHLSEAVTEITPTTLNQYRNKITAAVEPSTWNRKCTSIRCYLRYLHGMGMIPHPWYDIVARAKEAPREVKVVDRDGMQALNTYHTRLDTHPASTIVQRYLRCRRILVYHLIASEGLRLGELCRIQLGHLTDMAIKVQGKGQRNRVVYLNHHTTRALEVYLRVRRSYLIRRGAEGWPLPLLVSTHLRGMCGRQIENDVAAPGKVVGLQERIYPHLLRRTSVSAAVNGLQNLADLPVIAEQYGHTIPILQKHYLHVDAARALQIKTHQEI